MNRRRLPHQDLVPVVGEPAGDLVELPASEVPAVPLVATVFPRVLQSGHGAAAPPVLVPHGPVGDGPGILAAVRPSERRQGTRAGHRQVLQPLRHLADRAGADVSADVRFGADPLTEVQELVSAEMVVLRHSTPVHVDHARSLVPRSDTVPPVVRVGEAAPRPAEIRDAKTGKRLHHVASDTARIRDRGIFTDPDPFIDASAQVLREVSIDVPRDGLGAEVCLDRDPVHGMPLLPAPAGLRGSAGKRVSTIPVAHEGTQ